MKIFLSILCLLCLNISIAQNYKITYQFKFDKLEYPEETEAYIKQYFEEGLKKQQQISKTLRLILVSDGKRYYASFNQQMLSDNFRFDDVLSTKVAVSPIYPIYYNEAISLAKNVVNPDKLVKVINDKYLTWQITKETKIIEGYKCFKAVPDLKTKKQFNKSVFIPNYVWFSPELNFKASPSVFGDLPGAVLELKHSTAQIKAAKIEQTDETVQVIQLRKNQSLTTYEESIKAIQENYRDKM
ncbi:GLPGLI family protein [Psychroflexus salarius]|uniref:GLPGLI family protein n=1 Tax=Psychroflexus salarius TaxID=1155689 RepID=A0A1M4TV19_9FLAO|nr:GLPGLI family protein [Psychroflexus salarius]SHE48255.1 GLPGLI family protein [Psychroflexus salarius]